MEPERKSSGCSSAERLLRSVVSEVQVSPSTGLSAVTRSEEASWAQPDSSSKIVLLAPKDPMARYWTLLMEDYEALWGDYANSRAELEQRVRRLEDLTHFMAKVEEHCLCEGRADIEEDMANIIANVHPVGRCRSLSSFVVVIHSHLHSGFIPSSLPTVFIPNVFIPNRFQIPSPELRMLCPLLSTFPKTFW
ncbi:hypothetical protein DFP72DRAFT_862938 [Ephemerocybe angulata]|uniref:Uncharacterized protein n=1 Tax=Ephemerocybe angulata TaxID=980116 RepID=A0A8H6H8F5_9AGAR|nr:hypothetical protein DFP72DRAFT_862938 [Tulosesus angulatus]